MKPTRARLLAKLSFALVASLAMALPPVLATRAEAQLITQADRCREELAKSARLYLDRVMKARIRCENKVIIGELPLATDCIEGVGDEKLERSLRRAEDRLSNTGSQCNGVNLQLLGFPGVCPDDTGAPFDTIDYQVCVVDKVGDIVADLLEYYYPPFFERLRGNAAICLKGAPEDAAASLSRKIRARERCLIGQDFGTIGEDVDCRAKILPYGPGTGDAKVDSQVARAYVMLLGTIPIACADVQIDDLGYQADCPDATGGVFTVFDLKTCFFDANRVAALEELAINFPTQGVCGDGNVSLGEECDLGVNGNSDTLPNTCRTNCTNPKCSDGVTDSSNGETCDDGNLNDLDCCTNACTGPVCGDGNKTCNEQCDNGALNANAPDKCRATGVNACMNPKCSDGIQDTGEQCDDGNTASNDGCSNLCFDEFCGDEIVQSGPPLNEECDDGVDNAAAPNKCRPDGHPFACKNPFCGDGITDDEIGETCDDGNSINDDSCSNTCAVCGDGIKAAAEECDTDSAVCPDGEGCNGACECEAACPSVGELVLFSGVGEVCATNADCPVGDCDPGNNRCRTETRLDSGWTGGAHNADINNEIVSRGFLECSGHGPVCGECNVVGIDPSTRSCRCANATRTICDEPFVADQDDCGGSICNCYFGAPFPLSSLGTPACILNRFAEPISGTANVDLGAGSITAKLRTQVHLGLLATYPCPTCGGKCSNDANVYCDRDEDCSGGGTCQLDPVFDDGVRGGFCGVFAGADSQQPCDVMGSNTSFPAYPTGKSGGLYSLDCLPNNNVSGQGLAINLTQTTGTSELVAQVSCLDSGAGLNCPCLVCDSDLSTPCNSDQDCAALEGSCEKSNQTKCGDTSDCASANVGPCITISTSKRCNLARTTEFSCETNADCENRNVGTCNLSTCSSKGGSAATFPLPNFCEDLLCTDTEGGVGECTIGPDELYCAGVVKANGTGILACQDDVGCTQNGFDARPCNLVARKGCFPDPITATGTPDPETPIGASTFCVPPTSNGAINDVAGLPGPGRILNQARARTFCENDTTQQYIPGIGGCIDSIAPLPNALSGTGHMQGVSRRAVETETR